MHAIAAAGLTVFLVLTGVMHFCSPATSACWYPYGSTGSGSRLVAVSGAAEVMVGAG